MTKAHPNTSNILTHLANGDIHGQDIAHLETQYSWAQARTSSPGGRSRPTGMERPRTKVGLHRHQWRHLQGLEWRDHLPHFGLEPNPTEFQSITDSIYSIADAITSIKDQGGQRGGLWRTAKCIRELRRGLTSWPLQMVRSTFYVRGLGAMFIFRAIHRSLLHNSPFPPSTDT